MTFLTINLYILTMFFALLLDTPLDLGVVAQGLLDKSIAISVLIGVIYYMLRASKESKDFYKSLRDEDKVESAKEKEELHATFSKQENEKKETQKYFENAIDTLMKNQKETIQSITEGQANQINSILNKHNTLELRLFDIIASKDLEILTAYKQNIASQEKLANLIKYFSESQAEYTGKITQSIDARFDQIFLLIKK